MSTRVFVGNLNRRATERDVEKFFRGYGKIQDVILKTGFGFVDFADNRDAEDAVHEMNGKDLCGDRVTVEMSRPRGEGGPRGRGGRGGYDGGDFRGGGGYGGGRDFGARGGGGGGDFNNRRVGRPPNLTEFRVTVENLSSRVSWQDLKDLMSKAGEVTFADAHKRNDNSGIVCFGSLKDMKRAIEKFDGHELNGRKLKMVQEYKERNSSRSRSRSHSRSDRSRSKGSERRSRSRSRSASSHEASRSSKSKSPSGPPNDD